MGCQKIFDCRGLLLTTGFFATTLPGYQVSKRAILDAIIGQDLPLTSSNIYSGIQKDMVRPVLISPTMASDIFLRDRVLKGEVGVSQMAGCLSEVKQRYGAFSGFFVSQKSAICHTGEGMLKRVAPGEPRDTWYYRVRDMKEAYEINVDPDLANRDALTIFINYRVFDFDGNYIGLTVDAVRRLIAEYQRRFQRTIYFVDAGGKALIFGNQLDRAADLRAAEQADQRPARTSCRRRGAGKHRGHPAQEPARIRHRGAPGWRGIPAGAAGLQSRGGHAHCRKPAPGRGAGAAP